MSDKYLTVNIRAYLNKDELTYIGEESLYDLLSDFSCPKNPDVEYFLSHNAIEFTKKDQSITYLVFDAEDASLVGYFSLTVKPISIRTSNISKTMAKKLSRVSILNKETQSYTTAAYLIAQLGKNYSLPKDKQISGNILLKFALTVKMTLGELEKQRDECFYRVGRSALVNLTQISRVTKTEIRLSDGTAIPLPRGAYEGVNRAIINMR